MEFNYPNSSQSENVVELFHIPNVHYENRYCNQDDFSFLICRGTNVNSNDFNASNDVYELKNHILNVVSCLAC